MPGMNPLLAKSLMGAGIGAGVGALAGGEGHRGSGALAGALGGAGIGAGIHALGGKGPLRMPPAAAAAAEAPIVGHVNIPNIHSTSINDIVNHAQEHYRNHNWPQLTEMLNAALLGKTAALRRFGL